MNKVLDKFKNTLGNLANPAYKQESPNTNLQDSVFVEWQHYSDNGQPIVHTVTTPLTGVKFDQGKPRYDLIPVQALEDIAQVMTFGATKYKDNNWRGGMAWGRPIGACLRHIFAWMRGETYDKETGINHLAHACVNLMFVLEYTKTDTGIDDRFKYSKKDGE